MEGRVVKVSLYFQSDLNAISERYNLELGDKEESAWILEIVGLNEKEKDLLRLKYDRLKRPNTGTDWITGETPVIDIHSGSLTQYHDVSPFFDTFSEKLDFTPDPSNPPANTTDFKVDEVRTWTFTKN